MKEWPAASWEEGVGPSKAQIRIPPANHTAHFDLFQDRWECVDLKITAWPEIIADRGCDSGLLDVWLYSGKLSNHTFANQQANKRLP